MRGLNEAFVEFVQSAAVEGDYGLLWVGDVPDPSELADTPEEYPAWAYDAMMVSEGKRGFRKGGTAQAVAIEDNPFVVKMYSTDRMQLSTDLDILRRHFETLAYYESRSFTQDYFTLIGVTVIGLMPPAPHPKKKDSSGSIVHGGDVRVRLHTQRLLGEF
jgi:hypothetical protein